MFIEYFIDYYLIFYTIALLNIIFYHISVVSSLIDPFTLRFAVKVSLHAEIPISNN